MVPRHALVRLGTLSCTEKVEVAETGERALVLGLDQDVSSCPRRTIMCVVRLPAQDHRYESWRLVYSTRVYEERIASCYLRSQLSTQYRERSACNIRAPCRTEWASGGISKVADVAETLAGWRGHLLRGRLRGISPKASCAVPSAKAGRTMPAASCWCSGRDPHEDDRGFAQHPPAAGGQEVQTVQV